MSAYHIRIGLASTVRVSRSNVREIDLDFDSENVHIGLVIDNEAAAEIVRQIVELLGIKVELPFKVPS